MAEAAADPEAPLGRLQRRVAQHFEDSYMGIPMHKFPEDLRTYEQLLWDAGPDTVVEVGVEHGGSTLWLRDRLALMARYRPGPPALVIGIDSPSTRRGPTSTGWAPPGPRGSSWCRPTSAIPSSRPECRS